jgi:hypothetical protein
MRKLAEFVQRNCTSSISIANFRLQARVISSVYKGFDPVNNDKFSFLATPTLGGCHVCTQCIDSSEIQYAF